MIANSCSGFDMYLVAGSHKLERIAYVQGIVTNLDKTGCLCFYRPPVALPSTKMHIFIDASSDDGILMNRKIFHGVGFTDPHMFFQEHAKVPFLFQSTTDWIEMPIEDRNKWMERML